MLLDLNWFERFVSQNIIYKLEKIIPFFNENFVKEKNIKKVYAFFKTLPEL